MKPHKKSVEDLDQQHVLLSNRGLHVYSEFTKVVVLTTAHRLTKVENPATEADFAFNDRADRFVQLLRRLRDLRWTVGDYFRLCRRKRSQLSLSERETFAGAPL